jgi:hypothetical protein
MKKSSQQTLSNFSATIDDDSLRTSRLRLESFS